MHLRYLNPGIFLLSVLNVEANFESKNKFLHLHLLRLFVCLFVFHSLSDFPHCR